MNRRVLCSVVVAMSVASCTISGGDSPKGVETVGSLVIKIEGMASRTGGTRIVEGQGSEGTGTIILKNGHVFVLDNKNDVIHNEPLSPIQATGTHGQEIKVRVPRDARVFVVGNYSGVLSTGSIKTLADIKSIPGNISDQTDYKEAVLANQNGEARPIVVSGTTATVSVPIAPVIARIELMKLSGASTIKSFTVTGVFLDSYYPQFTYGGGNAGTMYRQLQRTDFAGVPGDVGSWPAVSAGSGYPFVASADLPSTSDVTEVWAHNVAAGGLPRLIVRMKDISYQLGSSAPVVTVGAGNPADDGIRYLTIMGYGNLTTTFSAGKIYRISAIEFDHRKLADTPNPVGVHLTVAVQIIEWDVVSVTPSLDSKW